MALLKGQKVSKGPLGGPGGIERPIQMAGRGREGSPNRPGWVGMPCRSARIGQESLPQCQEESGGPLKGPSGVAKPFRRARRGQNTLLEGQVGLGGPPRGPEGVGSPPKEGREEQEASSISRRGQEALLDGRNWLGVPPGGLGGIEKPSQMVKRGWESPKEGWMDCEAFQKGRRIRRPSRSARRGQEALPECQEGLGGVERPFRRGRRGQEGWERSGGPPDGQEALLMDRRGRKPSRKAGKGLEVISEGRERLADPPGWPGGAGSRREAHLKGCEVSKDPFEGLGWV